MSHWHLNLFILNRNFNRKFQSRHHVALVELSFRHLNDVSIDQLFCVRFRCFPRMDSTHGVSQTIACKHNNLKCNFQLRCLSIHSTRQCNLIVAKIEVFHSNNILIMEYARINSRGKVPKIHRSNRIVRFR